MKSYPAEDKAFWLNNPRVLFTNIERVIPKEGLSSIENLNALMRLFIIMGVFIALFNNSLTHLIITIFIGGIVTYWLFKKNGLSESFSPPTGQVVDNLGTVCQLPTPDNPFGNMIPGDDPARPPACISVDNPPGTAVPVEGMIDKYFKLGLYRDVNDVFDRNNSQQIFNTMPATANPNARDEFTKWRFNAGSCRDGQMDYCLRTTNNWIF